MPRLTRLMLASLAIAASVLLCSPTASGQSAEAKPKATAAISGRVMLNDKPAPGISVAALGRDLPNRQSVARATTDSEGRYHLTGLAAGQYQITALAPSLSVADQGAYNNSYNGAPGKSIVLSAAETIDDVDIKLVRGSVITGRVTDADGKPVVEQRVDLEMLDQNGNQIRQPNPYTSNYQMNQTDDRGIYRIYGLPAGRYRVSVGTDRNSGFVGSNNHSYYPVTFYPDANDPAKATIIELNEGSEAGNIDIRVGHAANTFGATGRVVDSDTGQPLSGIRIMYGSGQPNQRSFGASMSGLPTNARGEFRIEGLEPGHYGVSVSQVDSSSVYADPVFFEVVDADVSNLEIRALHGLSLSGVVVFEGTNNKEFLAQLSTVRVFASVTSTSNVQNRTSGSSPIANDGSFQINGLRPGRASLNVYARSYPTLITTTRIERGGVDVTQNLEIQPGESVSDLRIVVSLGSGRIRGAIKFEGGDPPPNARMFVGVRREGSNAGGGNGAIVDARGRFVIDQLVAGTYEVTLNVNLPGSVQSRPRPIPPQKQLVDVSDDAEVEILFTVNLRPKEGGP